MVNFIDKILNEWAFRCHDGVVDISNSEKINILNEILEEYKFTDILKLDEGLYNTDHFKKRLDQRGNILDIVNLNKIPLGEYDINNVKDKLKNNISSKLKNQADKLLTKDIPLYSKGINGVRMLKPILVVNNKKYPLQLFAISTKVTKSGDIVDINNIGGLYFCIIKNNTLITLLLLDQEDDSDLYYQIKHHSDLKKDDNITPNIYNLSEYIYEIDLDELMGNSKEVKPDYDLIDPSSLPYKLRTDYRKDANFEHENFGTGKIINTSAGIGGKGDSRGKIDWVDVKYPKPFLKGGKFTDIRRFENIYTLVSPILKNDLI
jgi:hypothetical protein